MTNDSQWRGVNDIDLAKRVLYGTEHSQLERELAYRLYNYVYRDAQANLGRFHTGAPIK